MNNIIKHPSHYIDRCPEYEAIFFTRHLSFNRGNALKYLFRHPYKGNSAQDLDKCRQYLEFVLEDIREGWDPHVDPHLPLRRSDMRFAKPIWWHAIEAAVYFDDSEVVLFDAIVLNGEHNEIEKILDTDNHAWPEVRSA